MTKLAVYVVIAGLVGPVAVAMAGSTSSPNDQWMADPSAADPTVRSRVMAAAKAEPSEVQRSGQKDAAPGSMVGPMTAAVVAKPVAKAEPSK